MSLPKLGRAECAADITVPLRLDREVGGEGTPISGIVEFMVSRQESGKLLLVGFDVDERFLVELASLGQPPLNRVRQPSSGEESAGLAPDIMSDPAVKPSWERALDKSSSTDTGARQASLKPVPRPRVPLRRSKSTPVPGAEAPVVRVAKASCDIGAGRGDPCEGADLKALANQLAIFEQQSLAHVDPKKRDVLRASRNQFEQSRRKCRTSVCARDVMLKRTKDIADIVRRGP
jgi:hypothetical protein